MPDDSPPERLVANLVAYDEALAASGDPLEARQRSGVVPAELAPALERAQECLDLLAVIWKGAGSKSARPDPAQVTASAAPAAARSAQPESDVRLESDPRAPASVSPAKGNMPLPYELGRFRLLEIIGQGGMGTVYKALHTHLDRTVAVKVLNPLWVMDPDSLARFRREIKAVGRLMHPNLVIAFDADQFEGTHYLVMEYVEGFDLQSIVRRGGPLRVSDACEIVRQAAGALTYIHQQGFVHRDIKPANLMLGEDGRVRVLDMGLALLKEPHQTETLTQKGHLVGTVDFMAPEQMLDAHYVQDSSDIYSLGCTLFHLLCGHPPFTGSSFDTPGKKALAHATRPVPDIAQIRPQVPAEVAALISGMMAKEPAHRPISAQVVARVIEPFCKQANLVALAATMPRGHVMIEPTPPPSAVSRVAIGQSVLKDFASDAEPPPPALLPRMLFVLAVASVVFVLALLALRGDCEAKRPAEPERRVRVDPNMPNFPKIETPPKSGGDGESEKKHESSGSL